MLVLREFRKFAKRYPFINLIVGVSFAGFLSDLIRSFISDIFFPILALIKNTQNILTISYKGIQIGHFIETLISFIVMFILLALIVTKSNKEDM